MKISKIATLAALAALSFTAAAKVSNGAKYGDWEGTCEGQECGVIQIANNEQGEPAGRIFLRRVPEAKNQVVAYVSVPLGVNLRRGLGIAVDGNQLVQSLFDFCDQSACHAALPLPNDVLKKIKAGKTLLLAAYVGDNEQVVPFSLTGATKAVDAL